MEIPIVKDIIKKINEQKNDDLDIVTERKYCLQCTNSKATDKELHELRWTVNKAIRDIQGRLDKLEAR